MATEAEVPEPVSLTEVVEEHIYLEEGQEENIVYQSRELEAKKIEQSSDEGHTVNSISSESTEQKTVEQVPVKNLEDEEKKGKDFKEENFEHGAEETAESILHHETCKTNESHREIVEIFPVKQGESLQREENEVLENELTEQLEKPLSLESSENEAFTSDVDKVHSQTEGGPSQYLEEASQKEENENKTDDSSDTKDNKTTMEEEYQANAEISDTSKSTESAILKTKTVDNMAVEDDIKKEESEKIREDFKDAGEAEDTEKHDKTEECVTKPEPVVENIVQSSKDDKEKEEALKLQACEQLGTSSVGEDDEKQTQYQENIVSHQSREFDIVKTEQNSNENQTALDVSLKPIEEAAEIYPGNLNEAEKPGEEDNQNVEESKVRDCILESDVQVSVENLEEEEKKTKEPTREVFEKSNLEEKTEGITNETCKTTESPRETLNTFQVKQEESTESEELNVIAAKTSQEEEPQKNEPEEKTEKLLSSMSDKNDAFNSDAANLPCQMEGGAPQNFKEVPHEEENEKVMEEVKMAMEEDNQAVEGISDASKSTESTILEPRTEIDKIVDEHDTGKENPEELFEDKDVEEVEEKENIVENSEEVEVEKTELSCIEEHAVANVSLELVDQEAAEISSGNEIKAEELEDKNDLIIEENNLTSLSPEPVGQVSGKNLGDEKKKANDSAGEILDNSKTEEAVESTNNELSKTMENPREIVNIFQEKHGENLQSEEKDLTAKESSQNLEETPQKEENEKGTEENNDTKDNRVAIEESLQEVSDTFDVNKTTESLVMEPKTKEVNMVLEDGFKKGESKELHENPKDAENEKLEMIEECHSVDNKEEKISKIEVEETGPVEDAETQTLKEENQSIEFEAGKSEGSFKEDHKIGSISPESIEQRTVEISLVRVNNTGKLGEKVEQIVEESNTTELVPESAEPVPVNNLEDEEKRAEETIGEVQIYDDSKVEEATESVGKETGKTKTTDIPREVLDTFQVAQGESLQTEEKNLTGKESSAEKKAEELSSLISNAEGPFSSDSDTIPCLIEQEALQNVERAPLKAEKENETEYKNDNKDNKIATEEDLQVVAETCDTSKNAESIVMESKSEMDNMTAEDDIKNEEPRESCENFKGIAKVEEIEKHDGMTECVSTKETVQSSKEDKKEEEPPKIEVCSRHEPNNVVEQSGEFEVEKNEHSFKKEHTVAKISSQSIEQQAVEVPKENENKTEESEGNNKIEIEEDVQEDAETSNPSKSIECTNMSLEPTGEKILQSPGDDRKEEKTSETKASSVGQDPEKKTPKEEIMLDQSSKLEAEKFEESSEEDDKKEKIPKEASETADFITSKENQSMEDSKECLLSSTVEEETVEESSFEDEGKTVKLKEEVDVLNSAFTEKIEETSSRKETVPKALKDSAESNVNSSSKEVNECLVEKSSLVSEVLHDDDKEEITAKEETTIDDSDSVSVGGATEEICLTETETERDKQVECLGPAFEDKSRIRTETKETMLENVAMAVKTEDISNLGEKSGKKIPTAADQATEKIENRKESEVPVGSQDKKEATANEKPLEETSGVESYTTTSKEHEFVISEAREITNPSNVSELGPVDTRKEPANEEVQKERSEDLFVNPELDKDKFLSVSEGIKMSMREESRELTDHSDDCTSKTLQVVESSVPAPKLERSEDEHPFNEKLKSTETSSICTEIGKDIVEQQIFQGNEDAEVEKEATEQKGEGNGQIQEDTVTRYMGTTDEKIVKSADPDQMLLRPSEAGAEDESNDILPVSDKTQMEENCNDIQNQGDENGINVKEEPKLEADEPKEENANEAIRATILAEDADEGVEQSNDGEDIKESILEEEHVVNELHVLSTVGERTDELQDASPVDSEYTRTVDPKEKTETGSSEVEESSIREREASFTRKSEEQKVPDNTIEPPAEPKKKIEELIERLQNHNETLTTVTGTISAEAQLQDKFVKDQGEPFAETTEIEETSSDLTSELQTKDLGPAESKSKTVENIATGEPEEIKIVSELVHESKGQGTEETDFGKCLTVEKLDQVPDNDLIHEEKKHVTTEILYPVEAYKINVASNAVYETQDQRAEGTAETGEDPTLVTIDRVPSSNYGHAEEVTPMLETPNADEANVSKVVPVAISESKDQATEESGESAGVEKPDQIPATNSREVVKGSVPEENPEADEAVETKIASNVVYQSKEQGTIDSDETGQSYKETPHHGVIRAQAIEPVAKDKITVDHTSLGEQLEERILTLTSELPFEHGATATAENIEERKTETLEMLEDGGTEDSSAAKSTEETSLRKTVSRELEVSTLGLTTNKSIEENPTEVCRGEGQTPDKDIIQLDYPEDVNKIKLIDSSSESKDIVDIARPTKKARDVKSETSEMAHESIMESEVTEVGAEKTQFEKTSEASKLKIKEEKEVAEICQPNSQGEEKLKEGLEEDELKPGECTGQKTNKTLDTEVSGSKAEELSVATEKATASKTIIEQVIAEDRMDHKIIKESFSNESEENDVEESAITVDSMNQDSFENGKTGYRTVIAEECNTEILQKESFEELEKRSKLIEETHKSEEFSFATPEKQVTNEANIIDSQETNSSTGKEHVPPVLLEGILETSQNVQQGEEIIKEPASVDSDKASLLNLVQKSTKVDEDVKKEREPTGVKEEMQSEEAEGYEEEGDEHKKTDSGSDAHTPVMVEPSRDMEVKVVTHKKSILSGVGSKVKHSISKVKRAITGKSSHHSKSVSPK